MKTLAEWKDWLNQFNEDDFAQFATQHDELLTQLAQAWQTFKTSAFDTEKAMAETPITADPIFRQPETLQPELSNDLPTPQPEHTDNTVDEVSPQIDEAEYEIEPQTVEPIVTEQPEKPIEPTEQQATTIQAAPQISPISQEERPMSISLPNARKGEPYFVQLPSHATGLTFKPECGLQWHEDSKHIAGIPNYAGDVEVYYSLQMNNNTVSPNRQVIYINHDPKDLWNNIPTPTDIRFYKDDEQSELAETPHGKMIAARVRGRSHAHTGKPCDDDYAIRHHATNLHFVAVSDGAGSAEFSRLGSQIAVDAAADTIWQLLDSQEPNFSLQPDLDVDNTKRVLLNLTTKAVYGAFTALHQAAKEHHIELKKLSCTLLFALSFPLATGQWMTAHYSVGDGAIANWQPETQQLAFISQSDSGSYSGETRFLTAEETSADSLKQRIRLTITDTMPTLLLMTDGVSDPKFETDAQLANPQSWANLWTELQPVLQQPEPEKALQNWLNFWSAGNHDDRTLAVLLPHTFFRQPENDVVAAPIDDPTEKV